MTNNTRKGGIRSRWCKNESKLGSVLERKEECGEEKEEGDGIEIDRSILRDTSGKTCA